MESELSRKVDADNPVDQIEKQIVATPEQSLFYKPFQQLPSHWSSAERERIRSEAKAVIAEVVVPAYQRLYDYFTESYLPACADEIGARRYRTERLSTSIWFGGLPPRL